MSEKIDFSFQTLEPGEYVWLRISDTGHGIPDGVLGHVFDPFVTIRPVHKGAGTVFSVVCGIVKGLGGLIT